MSPERFCDRLTAQFDLDDVPALSDELFGKLGLDSFGAVMLLVWLETISEPDLLPAEPPEIYTVADAYAYYLFLRENRS